MYLSQYKKEDLNQLREKEKDQIILEDSIFNEKLEKIVRNSEKQGRTTINIEDIENIKV
jgi:hypothetical protein